MYGIIPYQPNRMNIPIKKKRKRIIKVIPVPVNIKQYLSDSEFICLEYKIKNNL